VDKSQGFEVTANITYPCPLPFNTQEYSASNCSATIMLPEGLTLISDETTCSLGEIRTETRVQTSFLIRADEKVREGPLGISVIATGIVKGFVKAEETHLSYPYEDRVGGFCTTSFSVIPEFSLVSTLALFMVATLLAAIIYDGKNQMKGGVRAN
jgi:hypothetical protein